MDTEQTSLVARIDGIEKKIDVIHASVETTRVYFRWTLIVTALFVVVPFLGFLFAAPAFLQNSSGIMQQLDLQGR